MFCTPTVLAPKKKFVIDYQAIRCLIAENIKLLVHTNENTTVGLMPNYRCVLFTGGWGLAQGQ